MVLGESEHLSTTFHLAAGGNRCSRPAQEVVKTRDRCEGLSRVDWGSGWGFSPRVELRVQDRSTITQTRHTHVSEMGAC